MGDILKNNVLKEIGTFHLHSKFSDGKDSIEEIVNYAIKEGIKRIGFSDHAPLPYNQRWTMKPENIESYINTINKIKNKNNDNIEIYSGLEVDYVKNYQENLDFKKKFNLDYIIGSVHGFLYNNKFYTIDGDIVNFNTLLNYKFNSKINLLIENYYKTLEEMLNDLQPDVVGHLDLIKLHNKNGKLFNEESLNYKELVLSVLRKIKEKELIIEVNTGGFFRKKVESFYPSIWILKEILKLNIKVMVNSDSHWKEMLLASNYQAIRLLKDIGFKNLWIIENGSFKPIKL